MSTKLYLSKPSEYLSGETYRLAEATDLLYRRLRNQGYARRYANVLLRDSFTAMDAAAVAIIKAVPVGTHPVHHINSRNLAVLKVGTMSTRQATCLGGAGRVYSALRGIALPDGKFIPTAEKLKSGYAIFSVKQDRILTRVATLRPSLAYIQ